MADPGGAFQLTPADVASTFCSVAEKAGMGIIIGALEAGVVRTVYLSPVAIQIFGHSYEELLQKNLLDFVAEGERERAKELVGRILAGTESSPFFESVLVQSSGRHIPVDVTFAQIVHDGHVLTVNIIVDISERKRLEAELVRRDRLAAAGTLAAGVAHEINNPLALVTLNVETLRRQVSSAVPDPRSRAAIDAIITDVQLGIDRVASIVEGLRTISREDNDPDAPVDLLRAVRRGELLVTHEVRDKARVEIEAMDLPRVLANAFRLEQLFANLLLNAAQSFAFGSRANVIRVRGGKLEDGSVFVEVEDSGMGIPPDVAPRIFDPFFTTKPIGVGMGLGLSICHGIVSRLGGALTVASELGKGSTFRATFPASRTIPAEEPHPPSEPRSEGAPAPSLRGRARILVVDDEPAIGQSLALLLGRDHDVEVFTTGASAIQRVVEGPPFDVILCDLMMAPDDGIDVFERIAKERPGVERSVVFLSGGAVTERAQRFLRDVTNPRIDKPFSIAEVERVIENVVRQKVNRQGARDAKDF